MAATIVATFDPSQHQIIIGGARLFGFVDGEYINVEQDEDTFTARAGADGEVARAKRIGQTSTCTLTLLSTSTANRILTGFLTGDLVIPFLVKDGETRLFSADCWVSKPPAYVRGIEVTDTAWPLTLANCVYIQQGNPIAQATDPT